MRPLAVVFCSACVAALPAQDRLRADLLANGSAESPTAVVMGKLEKHAYLDLPGWEQTQGSFVAQTSGALGIEPAHGERFFRPGPDSESMLEQSITLQQPGGRPRHVVCRGTVRTGKDSDRGELRLALLDSSGEVVDRDATGLVGSRDKWRTYRLLLAVPAEAVTARVTLRAVRRSGKHCDVYFDDVALEPVRRGSPPELSQLATRDLIAGYSAAEDPERRRAFLSAMAGVGGTEVVRHLVQRLGQTSDRDGRAELIETLALTQSPPAVTALKAMLHGADATDRDLTLKLVSLLPYDWREDLAKLVRREKSTKLRVKYLARLAEDGSSSSQARLLSVYRAADNGRRLEVLVAMRDQFDASDIYGDFLAENLRPRSNGSLRHESMRQLAASRHPKYFDHLEELAEKETSYDRRAAWVRWCADYDHLRALNAIASFALARGSAADRAFLEAIARMRADDVGDVVRQRWVKASAPILRRAAARLMAATPRPGDQRELARLAHDEDRQVAFEAIAGLATSDDPRTAQLLEPLLSNPRPRVAAEALRAMWKVSAQSPEIVGRAREIVASSRVWEMRVTALDLLGSEKYAPGAEDVIRGAFSDAVRQVRIAAYQAATWLRTPATVAAMIDRLEHEGTFVAFVLGDCLANLTGVHLGAEPAGWRRWWENVGATFECPAKPVERKPGAAASGRTTSYYGIPIRANNIVFILDLSGSMGAVVKGKARLDLAKTELVQVLEKLTPDHRFSIIGFASRPQPWSEQLERATKAQVQKASRWVRNLRLGGSTNIYDSLELAFAMKNVDSIFLLSDGGPTDGRIIDPDEILGVVQRDNALRRVRINTISIGGNKRDRTFMRKLAGQNLGASAEH